MEKNGLALYRKWRPKGFDEVIGQEHITKTLVNQITDSKPSHAYLFCGTRGTGKTSVAKIFARAVNCTNFNGKAPCGKCDFCKSGYDVNMDVFELDAASNNGVDEIRELKEKVKYPPVIGKYKVYIVDEVHMLSTSAFNAFLKTLEEPPAHAIFILATTEPHKLPATILSRCIRFDFRLVGESELKKLLQKIFESEKIECDDDTLSLIVENAEGSVRDALSIADMCVAFTNGKLTEQSVLQVLGAVSKREILNLAQCIFDGSVNGVVSANNNIFSSGKNSVAVCRDLSILLKNLIIIKNVKDYKKFVPYSDSFLELCTKTNVNAAKLGKVFESFCELEQQLKQSTNAKTLFEMWCLKLCSIDTPQVAIAPTPIVSSAVKQSGAIDLGAFLTALRNYNQHAVHGVVSNADIKLDGNKIIITVTTMAEKMTLENSSQFMSTLLPAGAIVEVALNLKKDYSSTANSLKEKLGDKLIIEK